MKIYNNSPNINFNAKFIKQTTVKKLGKMKYNKQKVSLVEMSSNNDIEVIDGLNWEYSRQIIYHFNHRMYQARNEVSKTYAVTTQNSDFTNMIPEKILGIIDITNDSKLKRTKVDFLQTNPKYIAYRYGRQNTFSNFIHSLFNHDREYKGIGRNLIKEVINLSPFKNICLASDIRATNFYKKLGFKQVPSSYFTDNYDKHPVFVLKQSS